MTVEEKSWIGAKEERRAERSDGVKEGTVEGRASDGEVGGEASLVGFETGGALSRVGE
jgi:hypothetical protein